MRGHKAGLSKSGGNHNLFFCAPYQTHCRSKYMKLCHYEGKSCIANDVMFAKKRPGLKCPIPTDIYAHEKCPRSREILHRYRSSYRPHPPRILPQAGLGRLLILIEKLSNFITPNYTPLHLALMPKIRLFQPSQVFMSLKMCL